MRKFLDEKDGVASTFHYDEMTDTAHIRRTQDVEPILDNNKRLQTFNDGYTPSRDMKRIASIPLVICERWIKEDGVNWLALPKKEKGEYLRRKLNDPDNRHLRTSGGVF